jgi:hypothetical protein
MRQPRLALMLAENDRGATGRDQLIASCSWQRMDGPSGDQLAATGIESHQLSVNVKSRSCDSFTNQFIEGEKFDLLRIDDMNSIGQQQEARRSIRVNDIGQPRGDRIRPG